MLGQGSFQSIAVGLGDISELGDFVFGELGSVLAGAVGGGVRIVGFFGDAVFDDVLETLVHQTTVASLVSVRSGAVNQLLFGQINSRSCFASQNKGRFNRPSGREGPA